MRKIVVSIALAAPVSKLVSTDILLMMAQYVLAVEAGRMKLASSFATKAWALIKADPAWKTIKSLRDLPTPWDNKVGYGDKGFSKVVKQAQEFVDKHGKGKTKEIAPKAEPLGLVDSLVMKYISRSETLKLTEKLGNGPVYVGNKRGSKILSVSYPEPNGNRNQFMGTFTASGKWKGLMTTGVAAEPWLGKSCTDEQALHAVTAIFELAKKKGLKAVK
jgi:hypothetical protein